MYSYYSYDLGIHSDLILPELKAAISRPDVFIRLDDSVDSGLEHLVGQSALRIDQQEAIIALPHLGVITIRNGQEIIVIPTNGMDINLLSRYLVGNVLAILLYQRGFFVLHASAVNIKGRAIAFVGIAGSGKSSLAAALYKRGHEVISDDVSAVRIDGQSLTLIPAFPRLKLSQDAARALDITLRIDDRLAGDEKYWYCLEKGFARETLHLDRIYLLNYKTSLGFERLGTQDGFLELIRHSIPTRFLQHASKTHFHQCTKLAKDLRFFRLNRLVSVPLLPDIARAVEDHVTAEQ